MGGLYIWHHQCDWMHGASNAGSAALRLDGCNGTQLKHATNTWLPQYEYPVTPPVHKHDPGKGETARRTSLAGLGTKP